MSSPIIKVSLVFGVGVTKWEIPSFSEKMTLWRHFETEFRLAMRHLQLDPVVGGSKK